MFRDLIGRGDMEWALRQLSEYTTGVADGTWELITEPPLSGDPRWDVVLAALTCWAADQTGRSRPAWAERMSPLNPPWSPLEATCTLGEHTRTWWAQQTPPSIAAKGVIFAGRDLINP